MTPQQKELRLEDEREWLGRMLESDGWQLMLSRWKPVLESESQNIRAEVCQNRDWHAGMVSAYEKIFRYPEARIKQINTELAKRAKNVSLVTFDS